MKKFTRNPPNLLTSEKSMYNKKEPRAVIAFREQASKGDYS